MMPNEPKKAPFKELRQAVPVRLTTDAWTGDGSGPSLESPPEDALPEVLFRDDA